MKDILLKLILVIFSAFFSIMLFLVGFDLSGMIESSRFHSKLGGFFWFFSILIPGVIFLIYRKLNLLIRGEVERLFLSLFPSGFIAGVIFYFSGGFGDFYAIIFVALCYVLFFYIFIIKK